jgi:hypothetical protein
MLCRIMLNNITQKMGKFRSLEFWTRISVSLARQVQFNLLQITDLVTVMQLSQDINLTTHSLNANLQS